MISLPTPLNKKIFKQNIFSRRPLDRGETIQSYNHQHARKDESFPNSHTQEDDDNIDVVNDDDKDSGRHFYLFVVAKTITSRQKVLK